MKIWTFIILLCFTASAFAAQEIELGCQKLRVVADSRLTPAVIEKEWGRGKPLAEAPATLELIGCNGELLDRIGLESPLAKIDHVPLRGAPYPTYLVSADLTAEAGSYSGPLTIPVQIIENRLIAAAALSSDKRQEPIHLSRTGKSAWKKEPVHQDDHLLFVTSRRRCEGFETFYYRYFPTDRGWKVQMRHRRGLWESDAGFPSTKLFP